MANEKRDYKVFIPKQYGEVQPGIYDVVSDNESYDTLISAVDIIVNGKTHVIHVSRYNWGHNDHDNQLVWNNFEIKMLNEVNDKFDKECIDDLSVLAHSEYTVEEFVKEFGNGNPKEALKVAIRQDWDAMPLSKKRIDRIMIEALKNNKG